MAKYSESFKTLACAYLRGLNENGFVMTKNKIKINNVRELVSFLGISSYSLYKWNEKEIYEGVLPSRIKQSKSRKRIVCASESQCKSYQSDYDEGYGNCNMLGNCDDKGIEIFNEMGIGMSIEQIEEHFEGEVPMTFKMGTTFFQTLAQGVGIKNYRMPLKQLYLTIGNELIKMSGLVDNGVRKELRLE